MEDTMDLSDTIDVSPNTSSRISVDLRADKTYRLQPGRSIKCTVENIIMRMLSNCLSKININYSYLSTALPHHNLQVI
jgi:hypothetical protein